MNKKKKLMDFNDIARYIDLIEKKNIYWKLKIKNSEI